MDNTQKYKTETAYNKSVQMLEQRGYHINFVEPSCNTENCPRLPCYNYSGNPKPISCETHKEETMIPIDQEYEITVLALNKKGEQIGLFIIGSKFNVETIQEYISTIRKIGLHSSIIVYRETATPVAKKIVKELNESKDMVIELFTEEELQYNPTEHKLYSPHEIAFKRGTPECIKFKKDHIGNLPEIYKSDAISRFYGFERGDIIKITRRTNGYVVYRIVVER